MSSSSYRYQPPTATGPASNLLPIGEYSFVVTNMEPPHVNPKSGNLVCAVELAIQPDGQKVFCNPWAGTDRNGTARDQIAEFLLAIGRAPKPGEEPSWSSCIGKKGKAKLKVEDDLNGIPRNKVAFFFTPKQAATPSAPAAATTPFDKARGQVAAASATTNDIEPDDIPF